MHHLVNVELERQQRLSASVARWMPRRQALRRQPPRIAAARSDPMSADRRSAPAAPASDRGRARAGTANRAWRDRRRMADRNRPLPGLSAAFRRAMPRPAMRRCAPMAAHTLKPHRDLLDGEPENSFTPPLLGTQSRIENCTPAMGARAPANREIVGTDERDPRRPPRRRRAAPEMDRIADASQTAPAPPADAG